MFCCTGRRLKKSSFRTPSASYTASTTSLRTQADPTAFGSGSRMPADAAMGQPNNEQSSPLLSRGMRVPSASFSSGRMSTQHERLILELLPFKDLPAFHAWLGSMYVHGAWVEFCRDCLVSSPRQPVPEPDKAKTAQAAKDAVKGQQAKFLVYHPDKDGWASEDHHVRFIVTVIQDNILKGTWSNSDFKNKGLDIAKAVYEVLMYLRSTYYANDMNPPGYSV